MMKAINLILFFTLTSFFAFANVSTSEKEALISFYNSTNGSHWNTTWDLESPVESWYGVTVEDGKVVALELFKNNLEGQLPESIGALVNLRKLNLGFNRLSGKLPQTITSLSNLEELDLFMNRFEGALPENIGNLAKLQALRIYSNMFTGQLPTSVGNLKNLKE
ncbi:MAG: Two component regulator three Y domain protein, partial [Mangrovimonas sp.]|nr:Two component regulator three Y domain protein [Mangrovimonas sp.]